GKKEYINPKAEFNKIDVVKDGKKVYKVIEKFKPTVVFHLAAHKDPRESVANPTPDAEENIFGTLNILQPLRDMKLGVRVVFSSTAAVYSSSAKLPVSEKSTIRPASPYGVSKRAAEMYMWHFSSLYPIAAVSLRFSNVYGPRETFGSGSVITRFIKQASVGNACTVWGTGEQTRDFLYVEDVVDGLVRAMKVAWCGEMNLATNTETSVKEVHKMIHESLKADIDPIFEDSKEGELFQSRLDPSLAKEVMGWEAKTSVREGIDKTVNWCAGHENECKND
ncbi:GDP-mannose 4,6-dehydratase, partial [Candidatus Uhrbacteria bacterium]|nr:GDP-mannose 4,6-dehydratase [Candidatus Uhrbacteria bacterium]